MQHEALGPRARYERFAADLLYVLASGKRIDDDRTRKYSDLIEEIYRNPFGKPEKKMATAAEIKAHILQRVRETRKKLEEQHGSDDAGRENRTG